jgi:hypothetical protein
MKKPYASTGNPVIQIIFNGIIIPIEGSGHTCMHGCTDLHRGSQTSNPLDYRGIPDYEPCAVGMGAAAEIRQGG